MVQPEVRISSARAAHEAALRLESPSEVRGFEALAPGSAVVRAFLETAEWAGIRTRIMGDGTPPIGRPESWSDVVRFLRWSADGLFSQDPLSADARDAYLHAAVEVEQFASRASGRRLASVQEAEPAA